jgi:regulator of sirC expression with transglutaminase-like and TPR domain
METSTAIERFHELVADAGEEIDAAACALTAAAALDPSLNVTDELARLDDLAAGASHRIGSAETPLGKVNALNEHLFDELGFAGNMDDYYDPRNSLLNEVIERRLGIPITLSLLYIEVGARLNVPLAGVGMPGHFLVRHVDEGGLYVDPFNRGVILSERECRAQFERINEGMRWDPRFLAAVTPRSMVARMLRNLAAIWTQQEALAQAECVLTLLISLQPNEAGHRRDRGMLRFRLGNKAEALEDLERYVAPAVRAPDAWYVRRLIERINGPESPKS